MLTAVAGEQYRPYRFVSMMRLLMVETHQYHILYI